MHTPEYPLPASEDGFAKVYAFLESIGIACREAPVPTEAFLPGVCLRNGAVIVDRERVISTGDVLHEAGHLALTPAHRRREVTGNVTHATPEDEGLELGVICWSYLASRRIELPVEELFHPQGYKGDSAWLAEQFAAGTYLGLPLLQWKGIVDGSTDADGVPRVIRWTCD